jgi:hypothetical protein
VSAHATFGALRQVRGDHHRTRELADLGITDTADIVVVNDWHLTGIGYRSDAEREIAAMVADRAADFRRERTHPDLTLKRQDVAGGLGG